MPPNMKRIILANMSVKVYSWPLTFRKVVRQQIFFLRLFVYCVRQFKELDWTLQI